jgi:hypothetical protein
MIQRALLLSASGTALALVALGIGCSSGTSSMQATEGGADAAGSSSSGSSSGGGSSSGLRGFTSSGGSVIDEPQDSGSGVSVMDAGTEGSADGPPMETGASEAGGETGSGATSEAGTSEAGADAPSAETGAEAGSGDAGAEAGLEVGEDTDAGCVNLTVENVLVWCSVSVNGGTPSEAGVQVVCVPPGIQQLAATALVDFELGPTPWHDTAGDMGQGDPGTVTGTGQSAVDSTTVVVGDTPKCVWICCPYTDGDGCPPADQDQCP